MSHLMPTLPGDVSRILLFLKAVRYGRHEEILPEFLLTVKNLSFAPGGPACTNAVRKRLFCVSVCVLQGLESPSAACAYGAYAERYLAGWLCTTDNCWSQASSRVTTLRTGC